MKSLMGIMETSRAVELSVCNSGWRLAQCRRLTKQHTRTDLGLSSNAFEVGALDILLLVVEINDDQTRG